VDIVVKGHNTEVAERFRQHAVDKLGKLERFGQKVIRLDVEVSHERNPRQSDLSDRVEITCVSKGPVIRAEAAADDVYAALDRAFTKLEARLRKLADRRRVHHGNRTPLGLAEATAGGPTETVASLNGTATAVAEELDEPALVVREKVHTAEPMTLDQALLEMELVGHDFFLFACADTGLPSVVYRRRGYDYGVLRLQG
jgi:ribosomal subunit interface protein